MVWAVPEIGKKRVLPLKTQLAGHGQKPATSVKASKRVNLDLSLARLAAMVVLKSPSRPHSLERRPAVVGTYERKRNARVQFNLVV